MCAKTTPACPVNTGAHAAARGGCSSHRSRFFARVLGGGLGMGTRGCVRTDRAARGVAGGDHVPLQDFRSPGGRLPASKEKQHLSHFFLVRERGTCGREDAVGAGPGGRAGTAGTAQNVPEAGRSRCPWTQGWISLEDRQAILSRKEP